jgi:predicted esterase
MRFPRAKISQLRKSKIVPSFAIEAHGRAVLSSPVGYTWLAMRASFLAMGLAFLIPLRASSQGHPAAQASPPNLETGKILPHIQCSAHPEQSYALFLPSNYSPRRPWPLIVSSDPSGRGTVPLELQKDAAERFGYILAASNNSRNGSWKPRLEATGAMLNDVQSRVSVDLRRIYFAGFSGGARASSQFASLCKCSAGVLLSGAGFSGGLSPASDSPFPVYSAIGILDFNYSEVILLQDTLTKAGYPHWLRIFEGSHEWAPTAVMEEALAWWRIQSMKSQREPLDQNFIKTEFSKAEARVNSLEQSGDLLNAWREYLQIVGTYDSLVDVKPIRAKCETLGKEKAVRDALKREKNEFEEESHISADLTSRLTGAQDNGDNRFEVDHELQQRVFQLREEAEREKRPEKARVYKRALAGVFVGAMESGNSLLDEKRFPAAIRYFDFATQANPHSEWAWDRLAVAWALSSKRKEAINTLRRAHEVAANKSAFEKWLETEPAFDPLRPTPEFQDLLKTN